MVKITTLILVALAAPVPGCSGGRAGEQKGESPVAPDAAPRFTNRLAEESSPYLLAHARNPVDRFPWGPEAFAKAEKEGKPVFLSIGYFTCRWCHVMERESFENPGIARILKEFFVSVKVDREERPGVDHVYREAVQAMTGQGGWPLSVFLTPEGKPFWGGTYFPPEDRFGRPGFKRVLLGIRDAWRDRRAEILAAAERLTGGLAGIGSTGERTGVSAKTLQAAARDFAARFDAVHGGFDTAPKFPRFHALSFLLRSHLRTGDGDTLRMVEETLTHMRRGGLAGVLRSRFLPRTVVAWNPAGEERARAHALVPFLANQPPPGGSVAAHVCENYACRAPVATAEELAALLDSR